MLSLVHDGKSSNATFLHTWYKVDYMQSLILARKFKFNAYGIKFRGHTMREEEVHAFVFTSPTPFFHTKIRDYCIRSLSVTKLR